MLGDIENGTRRNNTLDIIYLAHIIVMLSFHIYVLYKFFIFVATHGYIPSNLIKSDSIPRPSEVYEVGPLLSDGLIDDVPNLSSEISYF
jgi:hypothetical protein